MSHPKSTPIERIYFAWDDALSGNDAEALLALYAPDAVFESPLARHLLGTESGVLRGHRELKPLFDKLAERKRPIRRYYRTGYLTDGRHLIWEYPREAPDGEQMDFVEAMELNRDGLIQRHCVYWGWRGFVADLPAGEAPVLSHRHFDEWGERYLDTDPASRTRSPAAVKVPSGAFQDIYDAWAGELAYDPARVRAPVAIVRGEWDGMCPDADARWLFDALSASPMRRDVKIGRATHLMHLEQNRFALYREAETFLSGGDLEER